MNWACSELFMNLTLRKKILQSYNNEVLESFVLLFWNLMKPGQKSYSLGEGGGGQSIAKRKLPGRARLLRVNRKWIAVDPKKRPGNCIKGRTSWIVYHHGPGECCVIRGREDASNDKNIETILSRRLDQLKVATSLLISLLHVIISTLYQICPIQRM